MKTFEEFLAERALSTKPLELKVGMELGGGLYLGEFKGSHYIIEKEYSTSAWKYEGALEYCKRMEVDGYKNWFLPSIEELEFAYEQDKKHTEELAFFNDYFWSSSLDKDQVPMCGHFRSGTFLTKANPKLCYVRAFKRL